MSESRGATQNCVERGVPVDAGARRMKIAAMVLLGLGISFYLMFALGEAASGEAGAAAHLLPALLLGALMYAAWKRPLAAGIILLILSVPLGLLYAYLAIGSVGVATGTAWSVQIVLPAWVAGGLLLAVGRRTRPLSPR